MNGRILAKLLLQSPLQLPPYQHLLLLTQASKNSCFPSSSFPSDPQYLKYKLLSWVREKALRSKVLAAQA